MSKVNNTTEMSFVRIGETYPDEYILVKIVEINHSKGRRIGIAVYTAPTWEELSDYAKKNGILQETIILTGDNLDPVIGGLL